MARQRPKRRISRGSSYLPPFARLNYEGSARMGWMYREVDELSIEQLDNATDFIRSKKRTRVIDKPYFTLVYPEKLKKAIERSRQKEHLSMSAIAKKLGEIELSTLNQPTVADVVGLRSVKGALGLVIDYPGLNEELLELNKVAQKELDLEKIYKITPGISHISIIRGIGISARQILEIKSMLPLTVELSEVKQP